MNPNTICRTAPDGNGVHYQELDANSAKGERSEQDHKEFEELCRPVELATTSQVTPKTAVNEVKKMEKQIDRPLIHYGLTEIEYCLEVNSNQTDTDAAKNIIAIVRKIHETHEESCALRIKVNWKLR